MASKKAQNLKVRAVNSPQKHYSSWFQNPTMPSKENIYIMVLVAILARVLLTAIKSYEGDIAGYVAWGQYLFNSGASDFYIKEKSGFHVVYAPLYLYVLWISGGIQTFFSMTYDTCVYFTKLTTVVFDFLGAYFIYKIGIKHNKEKLGFILGLFYFLNPGVFFNSSIWGQFDGPQATMLLITIYMFECGKKSLGLLAFALSILTKPQSGILAPIILLYFIKDIEKFDFKSIWHNAKEFLLGCLYSIIAYAIVVFPFYNTTVLYNKLIPTYGNIIARIGDFYLWMYTLYSKSIDDYPYATANAFNFWTLAGGQPIEDKNAFITIGSRFLSFKTAGLFLFGICIILAAIYYYKGRKSPETAYFASYFVILSAFFFATRMHERYLLPSIIFLTISLLWSNRNIITLILLSSAVAANHWYIYHLSFKKVFWIENFDGTAMVFAAVTGVVVIMSIKYIISSLKEFNTSTKVSKG